MKMGFIAARCTQCGAEITVDDTKEAGICKYCGTAFITEKAITNYNTYITNNYEGANINIINQGNPDYQCPKCQSGDIKALKILQKKPTYKSYKTKYVSFYGLGILFFMSYVATPKGGSMAGLFIAIIFLILGYSYHAMHKDSYKEACEKLKIWKTSYKCMRCGEQFVLELDKEKK